MSIPEIFLKELYRDLALGFKRDYEQVTNEIKTFEEIHKSKKYKLETRIVAKDILKILYKQRDGYAIKAEHYRALYSDPEKYQRNLAWC